jgi:hypothetical protein
MCVAFLSPSQLLLRNKEIKKCGRWMGRSSIWASWSYGGLSHLAGQRIVCLSLTWRCPTANHASIRSKKPYIQVKISSSPKCTAAYKKHAPQTPPSEKESKIHATNRSASKYLKPRCTRTPRWRHRSLAASMATVACIRAFLGNTGTSFAPRQVDVSERKWNSFTRTRHRINSMRCLLGRQSDGSWSARGKERGRRPSK